MRKSATNLRLPDKKGKPKQKALQRIDNMQVGVRPQLGLPSPAPLVCFCTRASLLKPYSLQCCLDVPTQPSAEKQMKFTVPQRVG